MLIKTMTIALNLRIATKIFLVVGMLGLSTAFAVWSGIQAMQVYQQHVSQAEQAAERAIIAERLNALVNAVVMESRGVYMAQTPADVEKFGRPLLVGLTAIDKEMQRLADLVPAEHSALFGRLRDQTQAFIKLRTEVVAAARDQGNAAANAIGNNDANRANRQALNRSLVDWASRNAEELDAQLLAMEQFHVDVKRKLLLVSGGVMIVVLALAVVMAVGGITNPLARIIRVTNRLAQGDTAAPITDDKRGDEIGDLARALRVFRDNINETNALQEARKAQAEREGAERREAMLAMAADLEAKVGETVGMVSSAAHELSATAHAMTETAARSNEQATSVAAAAEQTSMNVRNVATASEELSASISEISRSVTQSSRITTQAVEEARRTDGVVRTLSDAVRNIGDVVKLISGIAGQTNLLALNATIEAARAGEAGRGFAVVASEVKGLAMQTGRATEDIARQIAQIQEATGDAVASIEAISATIDEVNHIATAIASAVEEQGSATQEIARSVGQAAAGTQQVTSNIGHVSQGATITGEAARNVLQAATELSERASRLHTDVGHFIAEVRSA